ncbi:ubiquinol-cytochrome c reductase iron-sulfur subunit [Cecembia rubra]|uniref:Rieske-like 2Fe-2S protein n=1 Tax=Cecembia rubra TaxID=1485585 RepID=A0A2P8ED84_9BACT|nr:Rieske (2Fe-2S) protein [Cecembia rubra]PSL07430.1 Rieske-like 2Fe-2S protein [Cecembia rubra]
METSEKVIMGTLSSDRRVFLKKSGALAVVSFFGIGFFTSCSDEDQRPGLPQAPSTGISVQGNQVLVNLDEATALNNTGGWALVPAAKVLIVNIGNNRFNALTSVCTHNNCDRNWTFSNNVFTCTCHGSRFNTDGSVVNGPAIRPLVSYPTTIDGRTLIVDFG